MLQFCLQVVFRIPSSYLQQLTETCVIYRVVIVDWNSVPYERWAIAKNLVGSDPESFSRRTMFDEKKIFSLECVSRLSANAQLRIVYIKHLRFSEFRFSLQNRTMSL